MNTPGDLTGSHDLVSWLNALKRACQANELKPGVGYKVKRTPQGTLLEVNPGKNTGGGSGFVFASAIKYDKASTYAVNDVVLIEPWDSICTSGAYDLYSSQIAGSAQTRYAMPGWYVCVQDSAPATYQSVTQYHVPQNPPPYTNGTHTAGAPFDYNDANVYWVMIAPYPAQQYVIKTLSNADYYVANTWDGTNIGTQDMKIAKPKRLRTSVSSEGIDGTTINYSSYTSDNLRTASDGTNTEYQVLFPRFKAHASTPDTLSIVSAYVPALGTGVSASGVPVFLEEFLPSRVWARRYVQ